MALAATYLGAADDPWIVMWADIQAMINTVQGLATLVNKDIQDNKNQFSGRELVAWHEFVTEWTKWKDDWAKQSQLTQATSGNWEKAKEYKGRTLEWATAVEHRLGVTTPGKPKPPLPPNPNWWGSGFAWAMVGTLSLIAGGYFVRSFGVSSVARAGAYQVRHRISQERQKQEREDRQKKQDQVKKKAA